MVPLMTACATPEVVSERQSGDSTLTCDQLSRELAKAEEFKDDARDEKGVTGTNVAAAILFWPALIVTSSNADEAIDAAEDRMDYLYDIADKKGCRL